jgi:transcriptional regulator with XRE-family HTH domain
MKPFERISNPREIRRRLRMNQQEFWSRIGVTQSGGSRYESGRTMPKPVRELLRLVHIEGIALDRARGEDFEVVSYLKKSNPKLFTSLRRAATGRTATTGTRNSKRK